MYYYFKRTVTPISFLLLAVLFQVAQGEAQQLSFKRVDTPFQSDLVDLITADFNNDGRLDIVVRGGSGVVSAALGNGDGSFRTPNTLFSGFIGGVATGDFNSDQRVDLVLTSRNSLAFPVIKMFKGRGDGQFDSLDVITFGFLDLLLGDLSLIVAADFNNDQKLDLAALSLLAGALIFLGKGDGNFVRGSDHNLGPLLAASFLARDFNGDRIEDFAVLDVLGPFSISLGKGDGTFQTPIPTASGDLASGMASADFNRDGRLDIAVSRQGITGPVRKIFLGNGNGTFQPWSDVPTPSGSNGVCACDLNGDSKLDLAYESAFGGFGQRGVQVFLGNGDGNFATGPFLEPAAQGFGSVGITCDDFDHDGKFDIGWAAGTRVSIFINTTGTCAAPVPRIDSISPTQVTVNQRTTLTITGANFQNGFRAQVIAGGSTVDLNASALSFVSDTLIRVSVTMGGTPSPPYTATLNIINPDGQSARRDFTVTSTSAPPRIDSISPTQVTVNQPTTLTVTGANFQNGFRAQVTVGTNTVDLNSSALALVSTTLIRVSLTMSGVPTPPYTATLRIINPDGQSTSVTFTVAQVTSSRPLLMSPPGSGELRGPPVDRNLDTIVLTHGLQEDEFPYGDIAQEKTRLWTGTEPKQAAKLINTAVGNANVWQYVWDGAFQPYRSQDCTSFLWFPRSPTAIAYNLALANTFNAATKLAGELVLKLGQGYRGKIQFIGHSLGAVVNAYALGQLATRLSSVSDVQFTILDYPSDVSSIPCSWLDSAVPIEPDFFSRVLPFNRPGLTLWVDNYYSKSHGSAGAGDRAQPDRTIYNHTNLKDSNDVGNQFFKEDAVWGLQNDHSGVQQWYRWTINPAAFSGNETCNNNGNLNTTWAEAAGWFNSSLDPCKAGWNLSIIRNPKVSWPTTHGPTPVFSELPLLLNNVRKFGCDYGLVSGIWSVTCSSALGLSEEKFALATRTQAVNEASHYLEGEIEVPGTPAFLSFDYRLFNNGDGDYFAVFIDGNPLWVLAGSSTGAGQTLSSGPIPLSASGTRKIAVALFSAGQPNFGFTVQNLRISTISSTVSFVPIVLSSAGLSNSFFTSELTLANHGSKPATVNFAYTTAFGDGSGVASSVLPQGQQHITPNAVEHLRSLGVPLQPSGDRGGTLQVGFSGLSASSDVAVTVRTTTPADQGRAGLAYAGVPLRTALTETSYLCGLRQNLADRSNVALQNAGQAGDGNISLRITVLSGNATVPFSQVLPEITVPPGGFHQISGILQSNGLNLTNGFVRVERVSGSAPYYAYAVINDQANSDGSFVPPVPESAMAGRRGMTLPVAVEAGRFSTELVVTNFSATAKQVDFTFVANAVQTSNNAVSFSRTIPPSEQLIIPNLVQALRENGLASALPAGQSYAGPLFATVASGDLSGIVVGARTASPGGGGKYGLYYTAVPFGSASTGSAWLYGLQQNAENRSNLAIVNTGEVDAGANAFRIELFDGDSGNKVSTVEGITVSARRWHQIGSILAQHAPGVRQGYAKVTRISGSNPFIAYAVINDGSRPGERTGDGAFVSSSP